MCGIAGIINYQDRGTIVQMVRAMCHRGPDDEGIHIEEDYRVALGHRRLSIIDLTKAGHQPMPYAENRFWIVFNGEIFNYVEVRKELVRLGHRFTSNSDTEAVVAGFSQWGERVLRRLRGMFAFAIWDRKENRLFLAKDRFGIKPLYYCSVGGTFFFASEVKAILAANFLKKELDKQSLWNYLSYGSVQQPRTIINGLEALLPGHYMLFEKGKTNIHKYWDLHDSTISKRKELETINYRDATIQLRDQLEETTRYHLIADVPVGAFLSGGVDSTAVVGLMSKIVDHPIRTYTVGFQWGDGNSTELKFAKLTSERFGTQHTEVIIREHDIEGVFDHLISSLDQPALDGVNTFIVSRSARSGVTVALSGLGGDELFAGYPHFRRLALSAMILPYGMPRLHHHMAPIYRALKGRLGLWAQTILAPPLNRISSLREVADESEKCLILHSEFMKGFHPVPTFENFRDRIICDAHAITQTSYFELTTYLRNTLLHDADMMSMAHSLEVRPLLLDHVLAEYVYSLPPHFKLHRKRTKRILIDALRDLIPIEIINRPKMGFEMPLVRWLQGVLKDRSLEILHSSTATRVFSTPYLKSARAQIRGNEQAGNGLWASIVLLEYLNKVGLYIN